MSGFNIVIVIAIILSARLGIRLYMKYKKLKNEDDSNQEKEG